MIPTPKGKVSVESKLCSTTLETSIQTQWDCLMERIISSGPTMAIGGAKSLGYINGRINEPSKDQPKYEVWDSLRANACDELDFELHVTSDLKEFSLL